MEAIQMNAKSVLSSLMVATFAAGLATAPALAHDGRNAALIGGLLAGALVGAAVAGAQNENPRPHYYYGGPPPGYGYRSYRPAYYPPQNYGPCGRYPYPPCY